MSNTYIPAVLVEDANGIHPLSTKSLMLKKRVIFIDDQIISETVNETIRHILLMSMESDKPITLVIDSPGGSIQAGFQLIDVMEACPCVIRTVSLGCAASMSAVILAAGTKGHRYVSNRSKVMLHEPLLSGGVSGSTSTISSVADDLKATRDTINRMLCTYTNQSLKAMRKACAYDHYFSSTEALAFGLVDGIISDNDLFSIITGGTMSCA